MSTLKEYFKVRKEGYCTSQCVYYLIFGGCGCCTLREEFGSRKIMGKGFTDGEIIDVLRAMLKGVKVYLREFGRRIEKVDLEDVGI